MNVKSVVWVGTRTSEFEQMVAFLKQVIGLRTVHEVPDFAVLKFPNGDSFEVFGSSDREHQHFSTGPVVGFEVDDVYTARSELEAAGIAFIGPVHTAPDGGMWSHFRAPDGCVYEITRPAPQP